MPHKAPSLLLCAAMLAAGAAGFTAPATAATSASTSALEASRVDSYDPGLDLQRCMSDAEVDAEVAKVEADLVQAESEEPRNEELIENLKKQKKEMERLRVFYCGNAEVPVDYDEPNGDTYTVPVLQGRTADPDKKIGTLFLNPGGPGGSAMGIVAAAPDFLSPEVLERFDVIGVEPRQMAEAQADNCFASPRERANAVGTAYDQPYPTNDQQWSDFYLMAFAFGEACASNAPMMSASTTAEYVRDMEVVRHAIGEEEVNFAGFSYGTYVAQVYANMFPDRIRAVVADGVVDGESWAGTQQASSILDARLGSAKSAEGALYAALEACDDAGPIRCAAAKSGADDRTAVEKWDYSMAELRRAPLVEEYEIEWADWDDFSTVDPNNPNRFVEELTHVDVQALVLSDLYKKIAAPETVTAYLADLYPQLLDREAEETLLTDEEREENARALITAHRQAIVDTAAELRSEDVDEALLDATKPADKAAPLAPADTPDVVRGDKKAAFSAVICSDGRHPIRQGDSMEAAEAHGKKYTNFGSIWAFGSAQCAESAWLPSDEDRFAGPFDKVTKNPIMFVGNDYDPATALAQAEKAAARQPGSFLVTSKSWGHTAYGSSECVTDAVDAYLLDPTSGHNASCTGDYVPFSQPLPQDADAPTEVEALNRSVPVVGLGKATILHMLTAGR